MQFAALLKSVEELDRRVESETTQEGRGRSPTDAGPGAAARSAPAALSFSEGEAAAQRRSTAAGSCRSASTTIDDMVVQLRIQVRPDRTVQSVAIEDQARLGERSGVPRGGRERAAGG